MANRAILETFYRFWSESTLFHNACSFKILGENKLSGLIYCSLKH